jgi:hypothetical protein
MFGGTYLELQKSKEQIKVKFSRNKNAGLLVPNYNLPLKKHKATMETFKELLVIRFKILKVKYYY